MKLRAKRAIAGILASLILFAMLFTVGTAYFLFVNANNQLYSQAFAVRSNSVQAALSENLQINTFLTSNYISFSIANMGGVPVNVTSILLMDNTGNVLRFYGPGGSSGVTPSIPLFVDVGSTIAQVRTDVQYSSGSTYILKLVSQRGSVFSATYPPNTQSLAAQALSSGAIGFIYLQFQSFKWYNISSSDCRSYKLDGGFGAGRPAFAVNVTKVKQTCNNKYIAFSVNVTNLDPNRGTIVLDKYGYLVEFVPCTTGCGNQPTFYWYIAGYDSQGNLQPFDSTKPYAVLAYNQPTTLVFAWSDTSSSPSPVQLSVPTPSALFSFLVLHGCLFPSGVSYSTCDMQAMKSYGYGQSVPFLSTLFYTTSV